jgi:hypothetical protein
MKILSKPSSMKQKICDHCVFKDSCGDLPGLCILLFYTAIAAVVVGLAYMLITMKL